MRNGKLEMRNGGAGCHFPLDNEFPYGIIAIEKVPNGNGWHPNSSTD